MSDTTVKVLGICGSLRDKSFNKATLQAAIELAPSDIRIETATIGDIPLYNADIQAKGFPASVEALGAKVQAADALLLVTPEYNYSVPGVLKNAIDWVSRLPSQPFAGKGVAIMGASPSMLGTARAQYHLRQICVFLDMHPLNRPEVMIAHATTKFDEAGKLRDATARELIGKLLVDLGAWSRLLQTRTRGA
ncbi:NADPH-dependent FMN reductase [Dongia soli]|uniref:NAD(P)H-dependent oxidoreductase n=1 Tax=Dongia soli TaxID=600628 RepID=A0ABU5E5J9_9PROT|nr:NAD(P)H-dependent oxidoreductase [Dongia soli]MDY0881590.1 NAD(P)H-dependent oxidoreductase [Dongia soli]